MSSIDVSVYLQDYDYDLFDTGFSKHSSDPAPKLNDAKREDYCDSPDDPYKKLAFDDSFLDEFSDMDFPSVKDDVSALDQLTPLEIEWLRRPEEEIKNRILELAEEIERETAAQSRPTSVVRPKVCPNRALPNSTSSVNQSDCRKRRLCRHFLKGFCKRGKLCDFLHDTSIFCPDTQKVFLGGLPAHITADYLCQKLAEKGFNVINKPKVLRGFTPQVCLENEEQAKKLIDSHQVIIDGCPVDVRPYEDRKPPDDLKRSVFLGGLPSGVLVQNIKEDLAALGVRVCNHPILKAGFVPQVVLSSPEEAQKLIKATKVMVGGKLVEVRPYVNFRKRY